MCLRTLNIGNPSGNLVEISRKSEIKGFYENVYCNERVVSINPLARDNISSVCDFKHAKHITCM